MLSRKFTSTFLIGCTFLVGAAWAQTAAPRLGEAAPSAAQARQPEAQAIAQHALFQRQASEVMQSRGVEESAKAIAKDVADFAGRLGAALDAAQLQVSNEGFGHVELSDEQRQELNQLRRVSEDQLGTRYLQAVIGSLRQEREGLRSYQTGNGPAPFRNLAEQNLPEVDKHLTDLQNAQTEQRPDRGARAR
jgi:hypothetical protein